MEIRAGSTVRRSAAAILAFFVGLLTIAFPARQPSADNQLPAFPSAEGFGASSIGGRGGGVIEVTNLFDSGPGSLRAALEATGPRTVVFRTGGTIELYSPIIVRSPYVTIAGQTAPGEGIAIANVTDSPGTTRTPIVIATHNVVVRHLRVRPGVGDGTAKPWSGAAGVDGVRIAGGSTGAVHDVVIDHSSVSWALDENVQVGNNATDVTIQWSIVSEGLDKSVHPDGSHSRGLLATGTTTRRVSIHHNLFAHNEDRNPQLSLENEAEVINNVVYDYRFKAISSSDAGADKGVPIALDIGGNYIKRGPDSTRNHREVDLFPIGSQSPGWRLHLERNIGPFRTADTQPEEDVLNQQDLGAYIVGLPSFESPDMGATDRALQAYEDVLDSAGATVPERDDVDRRVVNDARDGTGGLIDNQSEVGGWPALSAGVPPPDDDHDGMPNVWESSHDLDPADPADGAQTSHSGYTWLEDYLNELAGDDVPSPPDPIRMNGVASGGNAADARTYSTTSISPTTGHFLIAFVANAVGSGKAKIPALSGNNLTWQQVRTSVDSSSLRRITAFRAFVSSPSAGQVTIDFAAQKQSRVAWSIIDVTGSAASEGTNGAEAIAQHNAATASGTDGVVLLPSSPVNANSRVLAAFWHGAAEGSNPRTGWTEIHDLSAAAEALALQSQWREDSFEQPASASWSSSTRWGSIALELIQGQ